MTMNRFCYPLGSILRVYNILHKAKTGRYITVLVVNDNLFCGLAERCCRDIYR